MLQNMSISNKYCSFEFFLFIKESYKIYCFTQKYYKMFSTLIIRNVSWAANHYIMISDGACDTEDWSNDC